ncbi:hypothetical protein HanPI659440_Chr03g0130241 [Helianthus annuus]|nr:hypothetical protein HanPI659440_Chr03g0130241 [Helianthus annuus]
MLLLLIVLNVIWRLKMAFLECLIVYFAYLMNLVQSVYCKMMGLYCEFCIFDESSGFLVCLVVKRK